MPLKINHLTIRYYSDTVIKNCLHSYLLKFCFLFLIVLFFNPTISFAQKKDIIAVKDSLPKKIKKHSPTAASLMSAALPGLGQVYNKKYWKVPIIYTAFGALGYFATYNNSFYQKYKTAYKYRVDGDSTTIDNFPLWSVNDLKFAKDNFRRYKELNYIGIVAVYLLNVLDASVDANLFNFDVSDKLTMQIRPGFNSCVRNNYVTSGVSVVFKF